jgi:hypothetical protein
MTAKGGTEDRAEAGSCTPPGNQTQPATRISKTTTSLIWVIDRKHIASLTRPWGGWDGVQAGDGSQPPLASPDGLAPGVMMKR